MPEKGEKSCDVSAESGFRETKRRVCVRLCPSNYYSDITQCKWNFKVFLSCVSCCLIPAGTWRRNNVGLASMRRDDVASTSLRRYFDVMCPLGWNRNDSSFYGETGELSIVRVIVILCYMNWAAGECEFISIWWMDRWLAILVHFLRYFSHIRTVVRSKWTDVYMGTPFTVVKLLCNAIDATPWRWIDVICNVAPM